jgi:SAM-dependent methyltransferase
MRHCLAIEAIVPAAAEGLSRRCANGAAEIDIEIYDERLFVADRWPHLELISRACDLAGLHDGCRVLELGCGTGHLTSSLVVAATT